MPNIRLIDVCEQNKYEHEYMGDPYIERVDWIKVDGMTYEVGCQMPDGRHIMKAYVHPESGCAWMLTMNDDEGFFEQSWDKYDKCGVIPF